jgi:hypothetical protein
MYVLTYRLLGLQPVAEGRKRRILTSQLTPRATSVYAQLAFCVIHVLTYVISLSIVSCTALFISIYGVIDDMQPTRGRSAAHPPLKCAVGVAVSESPLGPFEDKGILVSWAIDAFVLRDGPSKEGTYDLYLFYSRIHLLNYFTGEERIYGQLLASPSSLAKGEAVKLLEPDQHSWEFNRSAWFHVPESDMRSLLWEMQGRLRRLYAPRARETTKRFVSCTQFDHIIRLDALEKSAVFQSGLLSEGWARVSELH